MDIFHKMKNGGYKFKTTPGSLLIALLMVSILASLGFWQVARRTEKLEIEQQIKNKNSVEAIELNNMSLINAAELRYRKVKVKGQFLKKGVTYIDNVSHEGKYGFYIYVPFKVSDHDQCVLVNLGWLANKGRRDVLPGIEIEKGVKEIIGTIKIPSKRPFVSSSVDHLKLNENNLWLYMDLDKYNKEAPFQIFPFVIYLDQEEGSEFIRDWPVFNPKTAMHTGYAIMWFSLALIAFMIFIYANINKSEGDKG